MRPQVNKTGSYTFDRITFKAQSQQLQIDVRSPLAKDLASLNAMIAERDTVTTDEILPGQMLVLRAGQQVRTTQYFSHLPFLSVHAQLKCSNNGT